MVTKRAQAASISWVFMVVLHRPGEWGLAFLTIITPFPAQRHGLAQDFLTYSRWLRPIPVRTRRGLQASGDGGALARDAYEFPHRIAPTRDCGHGRLVGCCARALRAAHAMASHTREGHRERYGTLLAGGWCSMMRLPQVSSNTAVGPQPASCGGETMRTPSPASRAHSASTSSTRKEVQGIPAS